MTQPTTHKIVELGGRRFRILAQGSRKRFQIGWSIVQVLTPAVAAVFMGNGVPLLDERGNALRDPVTGDQLRAGWRDIVRSRPALRSLIVALVERVSVVTPEQADDVIMRCIVGVVEVELAYGMAKADAPRNDGGWSVLGSPELVETHVRDAGDLARLAWEVAEYLAGPTFRAAATKGDSSAGATS